MTDPSTPGVVERVDIAEKQRVADANRLKREYRKERRRLHRQCFWTRPIGHAWEFPRGLFKVCAGCGKEAWAGD